ncbi:MAG: hypothetical protein VR71_12325 [Roseovarius sp. BRH_c41]|uniref:AAA family ATPase n=1 Tax=Roseovarius sp. BRH_c41 TaxID=1629709 RepID=UPI0005F12080|nr:AAA family ATPase [Roseovarius sp. BRH_c41]KJS42975.1 MAG: hypothetical protein VR71_12325 [Roseovarius sp. BRH_c41]
MTSRITKLRASDFRSLNGLIDLDLDASVVLIHGPNGSGKTSFLSALEFALTGSVDAMSRVERNYKQDLVHYDATMASVSVECRHQDTYSNPANLTISSSGAVEGTHLLDSVHSRFFSERSFLAQATLSRLLEIYEISDTRDGENALTRFVKEILGLEVLDNVIEGLKPTGHKARLRKSVPEFSDAEDEVERLLVSKERQQKTLDELLNASITASNSLKESLEAFNLDKDMELQALLHTLENSLSQENEFTRLLEIDRELISARSLLGRLSKISVAAIAEAEQILMNARAELDEWKTTHEPRFQQLVELVTSFLVNSPSPARVGRETFRAASLNEISAELSRVEARLARDEIARAETVSAQSSLNKATERSARLGDRLEGLSSSTSDLARALSAVSPFVKDDECPVCHRDFREISKGPLQSHLSAHISVLTSAASELQSVSMERQKARSEVKKATDLLEAHTANTLSIVDRNSLVSRAGRLRDAKSQLEDAENVAKAGDHCNERVRDASEKLSELRQDLETVEGIRRSSQKFVTDLKLSGIDPEDSTPSILELCKRAVDEQLSKMRSREEHRQNAMRYTQEMQSLADRINAEKASLEQIKKRVEKAQASFKEVDVLRQNFKRLSDSAIAVRTEIVQQVFNESLNSIWKDLFVRLAPEEPFVPVFALPDTASGPVKAELKTSYRGKSDGGNPKAMLSAGNLNTAALTLFLSLHLSAPPTLPWLVLDDPVQNMDDIHIAQFAGLLKTLTRQKKRQVIIAVHEKPLFDYLALELSPASESDSLITVELARGATGQTTYSTHLMTWDPKRLFYAAG